MSFTCGHEAEQMAQHVHSVLASTGLIHQSPNPYEEARETAPQMCSLIFIDMFWCVRAHTYIIHANNNNYIP